MAQQMPLMDVMSVFLGTGQPTRLKVFEDGIEVTQARDPIRADYQRIRYEQIAQVMLRRGFFFSDLIIETRGGGTLTAVGLPKREAREARELIEQRLGGR